MGNVLRSVGLDVGTTSTQLIVSELTVENRAGSFSVPEMAIGDRKILYKSPVHFTPLLRGELVDGEKLRAMVAAEYEAAGISRASVDTGAVIITGETSRRENAATVLRELAGFAGDFVVATAGPDLESVLAAKGSGAVALSEEAGKRVLHMDIGGGTSNLALMEKGKILSTGCLNVGGRLVKFDESRIITYVSPVLRGLCPLRVGDAVTEEVLEQVSGILVRALEMAAGLRPREPLLDALTTAGTRMEPPEGDVILSFSGGVADCIGRDHPWRAYGDLGPILGRTIRESALCRGEYVLGRETIRVTVIGAGCHSAQLSGSTVFHRNVVFPLKNLPVVQVSEQLQGESGLGTFLHSAYTKQETTPVIALPGLPSPDYGSIKALASAIAKAKLPGPIFLCLEQDMAKALGQALALLLPREQPILCIDRVRLEAGSYLDVGAPVGPALPVVIKTLILNR